MTLADRPAPVLPFQSGIAPECARMGDLIANTERPPSDARTGFPFKWGDCWHFAVEYRVADFASELGFFVHFMGFSLNALSPEYAMFMSPGEDVFIAIKPAGQGAESRDMGAFRICFMLENILDATNRMKERGIAFDTAPQPLADVDRPMYRAELTSPNGLRIELWGFDKRR